MPNNIAKVVIIDSGAGGLSIAKEILQRKLNVSLVCIADHEAFPYGDMSDDILMGRIKSIVNTAINQFSPDLVIIGCNTASTLTLEALRAQWHLPFIGVVPAVKPAAEQSQSKVIGILATPATIKRKYLDQLISDFAHNVAVVRYGSSKLVELAEEYILQGEINFDEIEAELLNITAKNPQLDRIVLACTHFPLLTEVFNKVSNKSSIIFMDSGYAIANRLESLLPKVCEKHSSPQALTIDIYTTGTLNISHYENYLKEEDTHITTGRIKIR